MNIREYEKLKDKVDRLKADAERAKGAFDSVMDRLADDCGCNSIEEAEEKLGKLKTERDKAEKSYEKAMSTFQKKWGEKLESI